MVGQRGLKPADYDSDVPFFSCFERLQKDIGMLFFLKPLIERLSERPIPLPYGKRVDTLEDLRSVATTEESVENGFCDTFRLVEPVLANVSPKLQEKYNELLRRGRFKINLEGVTAAWPNEGFHPAGVNINISNSPADIIDIAHELGHMLTPSLGAYDLFVEVPAILVEMLAADELAKFGIAFDKGRNRRLNTMNLHNERLLTLVNLIEMFDKTGLNRKKPAEKTAKMTVLDEYKTKVDMTEHELFRRISQNVQTSKPDGTVHDEYREVIGTNVFPHLYYVGQFFSIVLKSKIQNGEIAVDDVLGIIGDGILSPCERLAKLGITKITPQMVDKIYSYAKEHIKEDANLAI